jgi:hypothetical protein
MVVEKSCRFYGALSRSAVPRMSPKLNKFVAWASTFDTRNVEIAD